MLNDIRGTRSGVGVGLVSLREVLKLGNSHLKS